MAFGARLLIDAVADGKRAASAIRRLVTDSLPEPARARMTVVDGHQRYPGCDNAPRVHPETVSLDRRVGISEVELDYDEATALQQAHRCLKCQIQTVFDSEKCILCGGCADVCPYYCLRLAPLSDLKGSEEFTQLLEARYGEPADTLQKAEFQGTAIIKDEDRCARCGLCEERCPTGAITMEVFELVEGVS